MLNPIEGRGVLGPEHVGRQVVMMEPGSDRVMVGIYAGASYDDDAAIDYHFFVGGIMGDTPQPCWGVPVGGTAKMVASQTVTQEERAVAAAAMLDTRGGDLEALSGAILDFVMIHHPDADPDILAEWEQRMADHRKSARPQPRRDVSVDTTRGGPLTVGELRRLLEGYDDREQVLLGGCPDPGAERSDWYNVGAVHLPAVEFDYRGEWSAVTLDPVDTFDTRQM